MHTHLIAIRPPRESEPIFAKLLDDFRVATEASGKPFDIFGYGSATLDPRHGSDSPSDCRGCAPHQPADFDLSVDGQVVVPPEHETRPKPSPQPGRGKRKKR